MNSPSQSDRRGLFPARDGTSIYYEVSGPSSSTTGRPLIFCYGLLCRRDHWRHQIEHLRKHYKIITFDYRGHNASQVPENDRHLTLEWCARDIQDLMDYLSLEEAVCLGHSLGVPVLTHASLLLKERIRGLVLVCGSVYNPFQHMLYTDRLMHVYKASAALYQFLPEAYEGVWKFFSRGPAARFLVTQFGFNPKVAQQADIDGYLNGIDSSPLSTFYKLLEDYTSRDLRELLPKVKQPTLVIAGDEDAVTPIPVQEEMARLIPNGYLEVISEGSHNAHSDFPDVCNERIDNFLERIGYR